MNRKFRITLFALGAFGLGAMYAAMFLHLPLVSAQRDRYLFAINSRTVPERNATDAVSAVNFDYRGFDTLGEEFILFVSVVGAAVLLREAEDRDARWLTDAYSPGRDVAPSDSMRLWVLALLAPKLVFGLYLVTHGQLTPGGGFQGGVVLATVVLILYLSEGFPLFKRIVPYQWVEAAEALGAGGYILVGLIALPFGREFLTNVLPLGKSGEITSAGTMPLISFTTGLEVAAGFTILLHSFLQELLRPGQETES